MNPDTLPEAPLASVIFENRLLYVCLAHYPLTKGHTIIVWKDPKADLHDLSDAEYAYFMAMLDITRDTLLEVLGVEKVYLIYLDEARHVHWHLVPRYNKKGYNVLMHKPVQSDDFSLVPEIKILLERKLSEKTLTEPKP